MHCVCVCVCVCVGREGGTWARVIYLALDCPFYGIVKFLRLR